MRPFWLIETDTFGAALDPIKAEVRRQGMQFGLIRHELFTSGYQTSIDGRRLGPDDCIIFIGTWPLWRHIQLHWPGWTPGGWCSTENLDCTCYYEHFKAVLLNQPCEIMLGSDALRQQDALFDRFGRDGRVFVRPTGCLKVFNGRCVDAASFASALAPARYDPTTQVVVSEPRSIGREWRCIVGDGQVIAASQYYYQGKKVIARGCPADVLNFAAAVLDQVRWCPDELFMMDVCESQGKLHVVELNGFSCAAFYACDPKPVVQKARELAERAWLTKHSHA